MYHIYLVIFFVTGPGSSHLLYSQQDSALEKKVMMVHNNKIRFLENNNTDSLALLLHDDLYYIHSNGWKESKKELVDNVHSGKIKYESIQVKEYQIRIVDKTAIVTGKGTFIVSMEGNSMTINLYYTEVYVITEQGIFLLSRHACKI
ncbi:MAG: nuclear transport factor 2 family protein [Saprospiraceae bacterium]|nr:nuclear transport factor 2 family protein [Saprospiraceae bacterium]